MKYDVNKMIEQYNRDGELDILPFWGHTSTSELVGKTCLSQWYPCEFEVDGVHYHTAEQYMMSQKAVLFGDAVIRDKIMAADNPADYKALGRKIHGFDGSVWNEHKFEIVVKGNIAKFGQNIRLKAFLLSTGDKVLVEASPYDAIWGVKLRATSKDVMNPNLWKGQNLLGFALMEARDEIRNEK